MKSPFKQRETKCQDNAVISNVQMKMRNKMSETVCSCFDLLITIAYMKQKGNI